MRIISCRDPSEVARANIKIFKEISEGKRGQVYGFFPTGKSPSETYKLMAEELSFWENKLQIIQIDEFVSDQCLFFKQLETQLHSVIGATKIWKLDPKWTNEQMFSHVESVLKTPVDMCFLGLGPNGHVGFQEPGPLGKQFLGGRVFVTEGSRKRVKGAETSEALTFGVGSFLRAKKIILTVVGEEKREIFGKFLNSDETSLLPASFLKSHPSLVVTTDLK